MATHGTRLSRKQVQAVVALLDKPTIAEAAGVVGVNEKTLREWLKDAAFQDAYAAARAAILERVVARLLAASSKAVEALEENLGCGKPAAENRAAELILSQALKGSELLDLAQEVAELKRQIEEARHAEQTPPGGSPVAGDSPPAGSDPAAGTTPGRPR